MNIKFEEKPEKKKAIPRVGECWRIEREKEIYLRISDEEGRKALIGCFAGPDYIYGVDLKTGIIKYSPNTNLVEVVEPHSIINGEILFCKKGE